MKKRYKLIIEPMTPVHIGTGVELTPLDYKLTSQLGELNFKKIMYLKFSSDRILERLIECNDMKKLVQFEKASVSGNMKELQAFFQNNLSTLEDLDYPCEVTKGFVSRYNSNSGKDPYDNALQVYQIYRPEGSKAPVIPGSSLKGSIRTAILNHILYNLPNKQYEKLKDEYLQDNDKSKAKFEPKLQKKLLENYSDAKEDPFRGVQIADCIFSAKNTQLVGELYNVSLKKDEIEPIGIQIIAEVLKGSLMGSFKRAETTIVIDSDLQKTNQLSKKITMTDIIKSCNDFYKTQFDKEFEKFYENDFSESCDKMDDLDKRIADIVKSNDNSFIIRVGRWSQVEFVTMGSDFRNPKTPTRKWGGTRTLFDYNGQYLPMGWCKCTVEEID